MDLEVNPNWETRAQSAPTDLHRYGQGGYENAQEKDYPKDTFPDIYQSPVFGSQKGLGREQSYSGPIETERIHKDKNVQDAHPQTSETLTPRGSLDGFLGPERRFLPSDGLKEVQALPRVPVQRTELEIPSNALRPQYRAPSYECHVIQHPLPIQGRYMGFAISRQHSDHSQDTIRMHSESSEIMEHCQIQK